MYSYESLKEKHGTRVSQTIDSPILIIDYFELSDMFAALFMIMLFGVIISSWMLTILLVFIVLGVVPVIRRRHNKGIFLHWPYRYLGMSLPGLINPKGNKKYSD